MSSDKSNHEENYIRLNSIDSRGSICDGPGIRTVVFFQGCERRCPECHNPQTWDVGGGAGISVDALMQKVVLCSPTKRVTISGGEPLLQLKPLLELLKMLRAAAFDIALYTGFSEDEVPSDVMALVDYIKTNSFIAAERSTIAPYVGSRNQVFKKVRLEGDSVERI